MQFPSGIEIDRVDEEVGMDVLTVCVGADQNFVSLIVLGQLQRGRVSGDRVDCFAFREALYHVIEQYTVRLVVRRPILPAKDDRALRRSFTTSTLRNQESGRS